MDIIPRIVMKIIMPHSDRVGMAPVWGLMTRVYSRKPVQPFWSVAVIVNVNVPAAVGVPVITPPLVIGDSPVGSDPEVMVNEYGAAPPVAVIVWL